MRHAFNWGEPSGSLQEANERIEYLLRLLEDLTPGGSEFWHNPERCAQWVVGEQQSRTELLVKAFSDANNLRETIIANARDTHAAWHAAHGMGYDWLACATASCEHAKRLLLGGKT